MTKETKNVKSLVTKKRTYKIKKEITHGYKESKEKRSKKDTVEDEEAKIESDKKQDELRASGKKSKVVGMTIEKLVKPVTQRSNRSNIENNCYLYFEH